MEIRSTLRVLAALSHDKENRMKALLCKRWGLPDTLVVEEVPDLLPGEGEAVVRVHAASVNFPVSLII